MRGYNKILHDIATAYLSKLIFFQFSLHLLYSSQDGLLLSPALTAPPA